MALVAGLIGEPAAPAVAAAAIGVTAIVVMLDGADGWLARRSGIASEFGARFDMEVDALLIMALAMLAWQHGKAGGWVLLSGLLRYVFVGGGLARSLARAAAPAEPPAPDRLRRSDRRTVRRPRADRRASTERDRGRRGAAGAGRFVPDRRRVAVAGSAKDGGS